jgi:hypothetical protein
LGLAKTLQVGHPALTQQIEHELDGRANPEREVKRLATTIPALLKLKSMREENP